MEHDKKFIKKWEKVRLKGKKVYIIINTILPAIVLNFLIIVMISLIDYGPLFFYKEIVILRFLILSIVVAIMGYFIGVHYWKKYEEIYESMKRE